MSDAEPGGSRPYVGDDLEVVKAEIARLRGDIERLTEALKGAGASAVESARRQGLDAMGRVRQEAETLADSVAEAGRSQLADAERRIREQPLAAVGLAFGLGMLVALLTGRR